MQTANHISRSATTGKGDGSIGLAFVDHALISQRTGCLPVRVPVRRVLRDLYAIPPCPFGAQPISPPRLPLDQKGYAVLPVNSAKGGINSTASVEITASSDDNPHGIPIA